MDTTEIGRMINDVVNFNKEDEVQKMTPSTSNAESVPQLLVQPQEQEANAESVPQMLVQP